jgi:phage-related protein
MAAEVAFAAKALQLLMSVLAPLAGALSGLFGLFAGVSASALAIGLIEVVFVIGAIIAAVALLHKAWRENWGGMQEKTGGVLETIRGWWTDFVNFLKSGYDALIDMGMSWVRGLLAALDAIREASGGKIGPGADQVEAIRSAFEGLSKDLKSGDFFTDAWSATITAGKDAASVIAEEWKSIFSQLGLDKLWEKAKGIFTGGGAARAPSMVAAGPVQSGMEGVADASMAGAEMAALQARFAELSDEFGPALVGFNAFSPGLEAAATALRKLSDASEQASIAEVKAAQEKAAAKAAAEQKASERMWAAVGSIAYNGMVSVLGEMGSLVDAAVQGAQAGGIWGAIIAVFMELLKKTESVQRFAGAALDAIGQIVAALEPVIAPIFDALIQLLAPIVDIFKTIFDVLGPFFGFIASLIKSLTGVFKLIGQVMKFLGPILQVVFTAIGIVVAVIMSIVLPIIAALQWLFGDAAGAGQTMQDLGDLWAALTNPVATSANGAAAALDSTAVAAAAVTESLMNVPSGYKVNQARFQAAIAEGDYSLAPRPPGETLPGAQRTSYSPNDSSVTIHGDLVVQAENPADMLDLLRESIRTQRGQRYGNPLGGGLEP